MKKALGPQAFVETFIALKRCFMTVASEVYADADMGGAQVRFLRHVARHGQISQADLARATGTDPALTGRALQGLIERGVLRRERSQSDRREYLLELGPRGSDFVAQAERARARLAERLARPLDARDLKDFDRIARKILAAFAMSSEEDGPDGIALRSATSPPKRARKTRARAAAPRRRSA